MFPTEEGWAVGVFPTGTNREGFPTAVLPAVPNNRVERSALATPPVLGVRIARLERSPPVDAHLESGGRDSRSALLKGLFYLVTALILVSLAYTGWIVVDTWGRVGV
jgi:hypothetical protein